MGYDKYGVWYRWRSHGYRFRSIYPCWVIWSTVLDSSTIKAAGMRCIRGRDTSDKISDSTKVRKFRDFEIYLFPLHPAGLIAEKYGPWSRVLYPFLVLRWSTVGYGRCEWVRLSASWYFHDSKDRGEGEKISQMSPRELLWVLITKLMSVFEFSADYGGLR